MWIERIANPPPFLVLKVNNPDINDIETLKSHLKNGETMLTLSPDFLKNTAYISRFIKNYRSQFRAMPLMQLLQKIKVAIFKIHQNNALDTLKNVLSSLPDYLGSGLDLELPSKQYFDYCLAKILCHSKILVRLVVCCKRCALYFVHFLQLGHYIEISTLMTSLLGHVWHQARQSLLRMAQFYSELFTQRSLFPKQKVADKDYELPNDLEDFLGSEWKEEIDIIVPDDTTYSDTVFNLIDTGPVSMPNSKRRDNYLEVPGTHFTAKRPKIEHTVDIGEVVQRGVHSKDQVRGKKTPEPSLKKDKQFRISKQRDRNLKKKS